MGVELSSAPDPTHTVVHGDCLAILPTIEPESVDAIITDPPYSSGGQFRGDRMATTTSKYVLTGTRVKRPDFDGDNRDQRSFLRWCRLWLSECLRVAKPGAPICVFSDWRQLPVMTDALQVAGWVWRGVAAWDKTSACRPTMGRFAAQCEYVVWGSRGPMAQSEVIGCLPGAWSIVAVKDKHHQTGKPVALMRELARICPRRGLVLDPFAGSGSTGLGALLEGRAFHGIEISEAYVEVSRRRLAAYAKWADDDPSEQQLTLMDGVAPEPPPLTLDLESVA